MTRKRRGRQLATLSQAEVARQAGVSRSTVQRAIGRGDLTRPLTWGAVEALRARSKAEGGEDDGAELRRLRAELLRAQTAWRQATGELQRLRLDVESGKYVSLELVQRDAADVAERVVGVLRSIPQRTALALDGALAEAPARRAARIAQIVGDEIERAIGELRDGMTTVTTEPAGPPRAKRG